MPERSRSWPGRQSSGETVTGDGPGAEVLKEEQTYADNFSAPQADMEAFAEEIQAAVADNDPERLADPMMFPNYVGFPDDPQFVDTREEFLALEPGQVFTGSLLTEISTADTAALEPSQAGFILSASGCPNIVFGAAGGQLAIVGINY